MIAAKPLALAQLPTVRAKVEEAPSAPRANPRLGAIQGDPEHGSATYSFSGEVGRVNIRVISTNRRKMQPSLCRLFGMGGAVEGATADGRRWKGPAGWPRSGDAGKAIGCCYSSTVMPFQKPT
jgi:hypothetical protein